jgi:uncharacterized cupin superfamily protein
MRRVSLTNASTAVDPEDPPGFRAAMFRFGKDLGAQDTGASLYEIPPGEAVCPYHYEHGEEEWLVVLEGRPSVRDPDGVSQLEPLDVVFFPRGPEGAHQVLNASAGRARVLMWSTVVHPTATTYPDSGKIAVWTGTPADDLIFPRSAAVDYYSGEPGT